MFVEVVSETDHHDSGLSCIDLIARVLGLAVTADQLRHRLGLNGAAARARDLVRAAKVSGLKAALIKTTVDRLSRTPLPAVAELSDGRFCVLARASADGVLIQHPSEPGPRSLPIGDFKELWTGRLLLLTRRALDPSSDRRFGLSWFLPAIVRYRRVFSEVLATSFGLQLFALVSPIFFQVVIDKVLVQRGLSTLDILVIGLAGLSVFECVLGALRTYTFAHTANRIDVELGAKLYDHLLGLPATYFVSRRVGDSVARVRELENIRSFLTGSALTLVIDLVFTVVFLAVMFAYSTTLTCVVLVSLPLYIAISAGVTPVFRARLGEKFARGAENQAFLVESVAGVETLKAMAVEPQMQRRWEEQLASYVGASFRTQMLSNWSSQAVQLISKLTTAAILYLGAKAVIAGGMTVGELVAFNMLAGRVAQPVLRLAQLWQDFHQARLSVDRLGDILNTAREPRGGSARTALPPIRGHIRFEHVSFRYRTNGQVILSDVSLDVLPGQVIGIVGPSGSGKSTLTRLIQRLYVPEQGRVLVEGVDLAVVDPAWLRRQIGVVLQDSTLFNRTVRDNIALADPGLPIERVIEAAQLAGAHEFILELPLGYDTEIGERGTTLSGGQRQRIAIARALVGNPRILILDEATSALDYESERIVHDNMRRIAAGRTVFIVAHRLSTVRLADRILTIERGRLVEDGTHEELIRSGGRYAALHRLQAGGMHAV